jgi:MFS transporter, DHA1 family, multidrug resistance protein
LTSDGRSWILQASSGIPIGCGIILIFMLASLYLIEVYRVDVNSALAINVFGRSIVARHFLYSPRP